MWCSPRVDGETPRDVRLLVAYPVSYSDIGVRRVLRVSVDGSR